MFGKSKEAEEPEPESAHARAIMHRNRAERLLKIGGVGHKQMERIAVQAGAHASLAVSYMLEEQFLTRQTEQTKTTPS